MTLMKVKSLLAVVAMSATAAAASAFQWTPMNLYPNPSVDISDAYFLENLNFNCYEAGVEKTDVMPVWIDEEGNEIKATSGLQDPWGFDSSAFAYSFNAEEIKANGEYILLFPEGMLVNAAGEKSEKIETPYTIDIPELNAAMFEDFEVLSITPDLLQPQAIWSDQVVTLDTNHNDAIGLTILTVTDTTTDEVIINSSSFSVGRELGDMSPISWEVVGSYSFFEDHTYVAEFVFYNGKDEVNSEGVRNKIVDRVKYEFGGRVEGYKYSDIVLTGVEPDPFTTVISEQQQAVFKFTFSGPVTVYQAETPLGQNGKNVYPESCLSSNDDNTVWTLDLSDDSYVKTVDAVLTIAIYARDSDGFQLKGDFGEESESCFLFDWKCDLGGKQIVVVSPASGESIDCLSEVIVKSADGEPMSWTWNGEANIVDEAGNIIGMLVYDMPEEGEDPSAVEFHFTKWMDSSWNIFPIELVKGGTYSVELDPGCFVFGEQFESVYSRSVKSTFSVTGVLDDSPVVDPQEALKYVSVLPEVGSTVDSIDEIILTFGEPVACDDFEVNVYSADQTLVTTGIGRVDYSEITMIVVNLKEPITEAGRYDVVIPSRVIINGDYYESNGEAGLCNPEYHLYYTIDGSVTPGIDPAEQEVFFYDRVSPESGSTVASLDVIKLWYPEIVDTTGKDAIIYNKADQSIVSYAQVLYDWDDDLLINVELEDPVTEAGEYEVVIPGRAICDGDFFMSEGKSGICNPEIKLTYIVDPELSAVGSVAITSNCDVYDVQGRVVLRNASSAQLKSLPKGIYVVGGKKLVVK